MTFVRIARTLALAALTIPCCAQQLVASPESDGAATVSTTDSSASAVSASATPVVKNQQPLTGRWLDLKTFSHSQRYRNADNQYGIHLFEDGQQRSLIEGAIKLDADARYKIGFRASSGRYFNWAYADYAGHGIGYREKQSNILQGLTLPDLIELLTAVQADPSNYQLIANLYSNGWQFYMRELYLSATPVKAVTVEFGSFGIERGMASEITTFDEDGYLSGERLRIQDPKHLFFDQIGYTNAFLGDVATPSIFKRGESFTTTNYRQAFAKKQLNARVGFSADFTALNGTHTLRQAATVGAEELKVVSKFRIETYERLNTINLQGLDVHGGSGFAITAEKKFGSHLNGDFGFDSVDKDYSVYNGSRFFHATGFSLNGDTFGQGDRVFMHASWKVTPVVTAFGFYTHAVGAKVINFNQQGLNAGLTFDLKALANSGRRVF